MAGDDEEVKVRLSGDTSKLDAAITASRKNILALGNDLAAGGGDAKTKLEQATVSMVGLSDAMTESTSISDEQRAKIDKLAESYATLAVQTGSAGKAQEDAGEKVGQTNLSVASLTKSLVNMESPLVKAAGKAFAVGEAFAFGYSQGERLRQKLNELTDGGFDKLVQSLANSTISWKNLGLEEDNAAVRTKTLANEINILRKNGIDPFGMSADEIAAKVEELGKKMQHASEKSSELRDAFKKERETLDDNIAAFKTRTEAIEAGGEITTQQADLIVSESKKILDQIALLPAKEREAYADRAASLQEYIDNYKGATTEYIANTEKQSAAAHDLAEKEIAERKRVTEATEKEEAKRIEALTKKVDDAKATEDKGAATEKTTKATEKATDVNDDLTVSLKDQNRELDANAENIFNVGKATSSSNEAQAEAAKRAADRKNAEIDLNQALIEQHDRQSEAEIATAVANTTYSQTAVVLDTVKDSTREVYDVTGDLAAAVGKATVGQKLLTNTYEETNLEIGRSVDGFDLLSQKQGETIADQEQLAALNTKYGETAKDSNAAVEEGATQFNALADAMERAHGTGLKLVDVLKAIANS